MTFGIDCYMGIDDHWKNPSVQLWHPTAGTLAHVPVPQFSLEAMSAADEEAQEYRRRFGFEYGNTILSACAARLIPPIAGHTMRILSWLMRGMS